MKTSGPGNRRIRDHIRIFLLSTPSTNTILCFPLCLYGVQLSTVLHACATVGCSTSSVHIREQIWPLVLVFKPIFALLLLISVFFIALETYTYEFYYTTLSFFIYSMTQIPCPSMPESSARVAYIFQTLMERGCCC